MRRDWGEYVIPGIVILAGVLILWVIGALIWDRWTAQPMVAQVTVLDKNYAPPYWTHDCSMRNIGSEKIPLYVQDCEDNYHPPVWTVRYSDAGKSYSTSVSLGMYDQLAIGQSRWLQYNQGGYWGLRYTEVFLLEKPPAEGSWK